MDQPDFATEIVDMKSEDMGAPTCSRIALVIRHLWELSDSIGYDCIGQLHLLRDQGGDGLDIRIFCENENAKYFRDVPTEPISSLLAWLREAPDACVIYHYCDGWPEFDALIGKLPARVVVRWHNNTPPWFFAKYSTQATLNTIRGLEGVMGIGTQSNASFWTNSTYSANQLEVLGIDSDRLHVVYPVSSLLFERAERQADRDRSDDGDVIQILFVGRIVPHKGYLHLVMTAATLQSRFGRRVRLTMVGRVDTAMLNYEQEIKALAAELDVDARFPSEVSNADLQRFYRESDVFLCLSEHEGFGLPIFEAMRFGLPVVGLRSTAIGEFLEHHPLAIRRMDYEAAAESVLAAIDPVLRGDVVQWQEDNLTAFYTTSLVARQLASGLQGNYSMPPPAGTVDPAIAESVDRFRVALREAHPFGARRLAPRPLVDTISRYVTRYDVAAISALAKAAPPKKRGPIKRITREIERFAKRTWRIVAPAVGAR